jgi:hypothetical protein
VLTRAHGAEGEGQAGLARGHETLDVVAERDGAAGLQIESGEPAARALGAGLEVIEEDARVVGHERGAEPPVGGLAGQLEAARRERGQIDRDVRPRLRQGGA